MPALEKFKLENLKEDIISLLEEYSATTLIKSYKDILRKRNIISQTQSSIFETNTTKLNQTDTEVLKKTSYPPNTLKTIQEENIQYETIITKEQLDTLIEKLKSASYVAIDTETTSLNIHEAQIIGISVSFRELESYYIPIETKEKNILKKNI